MYLCNWWRLTKRRVHEREVELAFSGQRVAAEGHGDLLHRDLEAGRRERLDEDVGRPTDSSKRGRAVGRHRMYQRQRRLVRAEERPDDAAAVAADNRPEAVRSRVVGPTSEFLARSRNGSAEWTAASVTSASGAA